jgi:predicted nuclease of predicted toxin-antitoxin system
MLKLVTDANFNGRVSRALLREQPDLDLIRVQDVGLGSAPDPEILEWAASVERIVLTHDFDTMPGFAYDRVRAGLPMPGLLVLRNRPNQIGLMAADIPPGCACSTQEECRDRVQFLPL